jgi:tetratricopeptide (TPR) repeat protein/DNA-binding CsgD family transcriptional regulator
MTWARGHTKHRLCICPEVVPEYNNDIYSGFALMSGGAMAIPFDTPLVCPVLVGRQAYLHALDNCIRTALDNTGQTVLVSGESGLGKSRLAAQARSRAAVNGMTVLQGNCFETDHALPYAPLIDLLRYIPASGLAPSLENDIDSEQPGPAAMLSELAAQQPDRAEGGLAPEQAKRRLFESLAQQLLQFARRNPVLIVIEDLHWSDDLSLEFLGYLIRLSKQDPLMLLLTYRNDEDQPALRHFLAGLDRERSAMELALVPLSRVEVEEMVRAIFSLEGQVRGEFLDAIYPLTEGNPFFVEEILKSLTSAGDVSSASGPLDRGLTGQVQALHVPRTVQDAVQRRVERLSASARQTLELASVLGKRFDYALLQQLTGRDEHSLVQDIKQLVAAQLVIEESAEQLAFRHALTRQAVYTNLLARERRILHKRVAQSIEQSHTTNSQARLAELAYHHFEAGEWDKALTYSSQMGQRASRLYAPREAIQHFDQALEAAGHLVAVAPLHVYRERGQAYETLGEFERARGDYETALGMARSSGDRAAEWQSLLDLGMLWSGRDYQRAGEYYSKALLLARQEDNPTMLAYSLNRVGNLHLNTERPAEALQYHREALQILERLGDRPGMAGTLDLLGMTNYLSGDLFAGTLYYRDATALFDELDNRPGLTSSLATLMMRGPTYQTDTMVTMGNLLEAARDGERALEIARQIGQRSGEAYALVFLGFCLGPGGEYARALETAGSGLAIAKEIDHLQWLTAAHCALGAIYVDLLLAEEARSHLEQALSLARGIGSLHWVRCASAYLARACILDGDFDGARKVLDESLGPETGIQSLGQRAGWCARAELALAIGDNEEASRIANRLVSLAPNTSAGHPIPRLWWLLAETMLRAGKKEHFPEAERLLQEAEQVALQRGAVSMSWRINLTWGRIHQAQGQRKEAADRFAMAREIVNRLAAGIPDSALRDGFLKGASEAIPAGPSASRRLALRAEYGGLTARERQVAVLVAEGKSNAEIAEIMVIGKRTVETYISDILSKLGMRSRQQIVVWVRERRPTGNPGGD